MADRNLSVRAGSNRYLAVAVTDRNGGRPVAGSPPYSGPPEGLGKRLARLASLYDRQADAPDQGLGVVPQGILLVPVPDFENNDLRGPEGTVPGRANFAYLDPLFAGYLEPGGPDPPWRLKDDGDFDLGVTLYGLDDRHGGIGNI